jgi:AcrR family transcriptional regulator
MPATAPKRLGRPPSLSREQIVEAGLELLDRQGLEALTLRRLGEQLGVTPMALYSYFAGKDDLVDAILDHAAEEVRLPPREGTWEDQMRALMREARRVLARHPSALGVRLRRPLLSPGPLRVTEAGLQILLEAGFTRKQAVSAWRALFSYMFGFVSFSPDTGRRSSTEQARSILSALPAEDYPALTSAADEAASAMSGDREFEFGLDRIVEGLARLLPPPRTE